MYRTMCSPVKSPTFPGAAENIKDSNPTTHNNNKALFFSGHEITPLRAGGRQDNPHKITPEDKPCQSHQLKLHALLGW